MKDFFKRKKVWFLGICFFILLGFSSSFFYYQKYLKIKNPEIKVAERSPQSRARAIYKAGQNLNKVTHPNTISDNVINIEDIRALENAKKAKRARVKTATNNKELKTMKSLNTNMDLSNSKFVKYQLSYHSFNDSILTGSLIKNCKLLSATFENANLQNVVFLDNYNIGGINFYNAKMQGVKFLGVNKLDKAIRPMDFRGAKLQGADLSRLDRLPEYADLRGAYYDSHTKLPFDHATAQKLGMIKVFPPVHF